MSGIFFLICLRISCLHTVYIFNCSILLSLVPVHLNLMIAFLYSYCLLCDGNLGTQLQIGLKRLQMMSHT